MNNRVSLGSLGLKALRLIIDDISRRSAEIIGREDLYEVSFFF